MRHSAAGCLLLALLATVTSCSRSTGKLTPQQLQELQSEGITRREDDLWIRYTHGMGTARGGWEEHRASIVVTGSRILIHRNERVILEITERSTGRYAVRREGDRLSLRSGTGRAARSWAFHPADDPEGWARDMRAVLKKTAGAARESRWLPEHGPEAAPLALRRVPARAAAVRDRCIFPWRQRVLFDNIVT